MERTGQGVGAQHLTRRRKLADPAHFAPPPPTACPANLQRPAHPAHQFWRCVVLPVHPFHCLPAEWAMQGLGRAALRPTARRLPIQPSLDLVPIPRRAHVHCGDQPLRLLQAHGIGGEELLRSRPAPRVRSSKSRLRSERSEIVRKTRFSNGGSWLRSRLRHKRDPLIVLKNRLVLVAHVQRVADTCLPVSPRIG